MLVNDIPNVTLASADPALLLCWENMVRQGTECSLLLKHSKGKIITILKSTGPRYLSKRILLQLLLILLQLRRRRKRKEEINRRDWKPSYLTTNAWYKRKDCHPVN